MKQYKRLLTIAGSDSGGGAGIQADIKTFSALGGFGMSVITALTAQNTQGVHGIHAVPPPFITEQLDAVLSDIGADAIKIGMLHSPEVIQVVAEGLTRYDVKYIVLDPVMVAKGGSKLLQDEAIAALKELLFPLVTLITPNLPEAEVLLNKPIKTIADMRQAAEELAALGPGAVLIKGGHMEGVESIDVLYHKGEWHEFNSKRIACTNTHGTGCTLSAAIAAYLAGGEALPQAISKAKLFITGAIEAGSAYSTGKGHGPVHHFHALWRE
jgi:hydroxymethylpyrimidine/phosphomethylpyrimidine kinase